MAFTAAAVRQLELGLKRFSCWCEHGVFERLHEVCAGVPDLEHLIIDSTIVRAHRVPRARRKRRGGQQAQALGRSQGGFSTMIHIAVDALGNPLGLLLTGERHDSPQAEALIDG